MEAFPFLFMLIALVFAFFISYASFESQERKKEAWAHLASKHNLTYTPGTFLGPKGRVNGLYRDCYLSLETVQKGQGKQSHTYTALTLTKQYNSSAEKTLSPEEALQWFAKLWLNVDNATLKVEQNGRELIYQVYGLETNSRHLEQLFDMMSDLLYNYEAILDLGSEAVAPLAKMASRKDLFRDVAIWLLERISGQTTQRFGYHPEQYLCPDCLVSFEAYDVSLSWWRSLTFYGCRQCSRSRRFLNGRVLAVLDNQMTEAWTAGQDRVVRLNWLARREPMDFDEVHIVRADDEDVERFAVQVGNDTDPKRRDRYAHTPCTVAAECCLSPNTLRILERTFSDVAVLKAVEHVEERATQTTIPQ